MAVTNLTPDAMHKVLAELEQALFNHEQWCEGLYGTLICRLPPDDRDLAADAHQRCRFGQWYYGQSNVNLRNYRGFDEIAIEHQRMHQYAAALLTASARGEQASLPDH
ncbi:MAG TPA: CZB domain-containing protein, partial [Terriglobales bacterium]